MDEKVRGGLSAAAYCKVIPINGYAVVAYRWERRAYDLHDLAIFCSLERLG